MYNVDLILQTNLVLNLFIRCIIIYFFLLIAMRLMGKRQLGELQPFELAITLVAAELACIPMSDYTIPIIYGIIPVFTLFLVHILITKIAVKSIRFRKVLNGSPIVVIDKGTILSKELKRLDMDANDLLEGLRGNGYFTPAEIECAIIETNGTMTVMPKFANKPVSNADMKVVGGQSELPITLIVEGRWMQINMAVAESYITKEQIFKALENLGYEQMDIFLLILTGETVFIQPMCGDAIIRSIAELSQEEYNKVANGEEKERSLSGGGN